MESAIVSAAVEGRSVSSICPVPGKLTVLQAPNWVFAPGGMNGGEEQVCFRLFYCKLKDISSVAWQSSSMLHHETILRADPAPGVLRIVGQHLQAKILFLLQGRGVATWPGLTAGVQSSFAARLLLGIICHP